MSKRTADAVVIGGGHHGLVAANVLADAGWDVCLLEAAETVGGAVRSPELHPGFTADLYSAFYPLGHGSPVLRAMELEEHGLNWAHAPTVLTHLLGPDDERAAVLHLPDRVDSRTRPTVHLDHAPGVTTSRVLNHRGSPDAASGRAAVARGTRRHPRSSMF